MKAAADSNYWIAFRVFAATECRINRHLYTVADAFGRIPSCQGLFALLRRHEATALFRPGGTHLSASLAVLDKLMRLSLSM